jgi:hypothetical protein
LQAHLLFSSVLLVAIRSLVHVLLPQLSFTRNWTETVTAFTSPQLEVTASSGTLLVWNWTIPNITKVALYSLHTDHAQNTRFYCFTWIIETWTSHETPSQYWWSVMSCTCVEVCLPSRNLETDCIILLFHCWYVLLLRNGWFCGSTFLAWGKYATLLPP